MFSEELTCQKYEAKRVRGLDIRSRWIGTKLIISLVLGKTKPRLSTH